MCDKWYKLEGKTLGDRNQLITNAPHSPAAASREKKWAHFDRTAANFHNLRSSGGLFVSVTAATFSNLLFFRISFTRRIRAHEIEPHTTWSECQKVEWNRSNRVWDSMFRSYNRTQNKTVIWMAAKPISQPPESISNRWIGQSLLMRYVVVVFLFLFVIVILISSQWGANKMENTIHFNSFSNKVQKKISACKRAHSQSYAWHVKICCALFLFREKPTDSFSKWRLKMEKRNANATNCLNRFHFAYINKWIKLAYFATN